MIYKGYNIRPFSDLFKADLSGADLSGVNLRGADLSCANLRDANLSCANLLDADLRCANLIGANLSSANLRGADLRGASLSGVNLSGADLRGASLSGVNLRDANLSGAILIETEQIRKGIKLTDNLIGWKKCKDKSGNPVIVKLEMPRGAIVVSINNNKCRTDRAKVIEIIGADRAYSTYKFFSYYVGDEIEVFNFNCEYNSECAKGIHFFRSLEDAEKYHL